MTDELKEVVSDCTLAASIAESVSLKSSLSIGSGIYFDVRDKTIKIQVV